MIVRLLTAASLAAGLAGPCPVSAQVTFSSESRVVVLHVAVLDRKNHVSGLGQDAFRVFDNGRPQEVSFFNSQDAPATVGLLIDGSGSMGANRDRVVAAALAFAEHSNPEDEIFVLGFNERVITALPPESPFARDIPTLRSALGRAIGARGQTAVYDAIAAGLEYLEKGAHERKVLVLVSDGGDNASTTPRARVLAEVQASNAVIYTVGVIDPLETESDRGFLRQLSDSSGGLSFEPRRVADVGAVLQEVSRDIRNVYTLGYVPPANGENDGKREALRRVSVQVTLPDGRKPTVRTRRAYLAGEIGGSAGDAHEPAEH